MIEETERLPARLDPASTSEVVLHPARLAAAVVLAGSLSVVGTAGVQLHGGSHGWDRAMAALVIAIGLAVAAFSGAMMMPRLTFLRLSAAGLEIRYLGRGGSWPWSDVDRAVYEKSGTQGRMRLRLRSRPSSIRIWNSYSLPRRELSVLINRWREHHSQQPTAI